MSNTSRPGPKAVQRLTAEGRILAGFLTEETAGRVPQFVSAQPPVQSRIREKFGTASTRMSADDIEYPIFRHVEEPEAIQVLSAVGAQCGGPAHLSNLVGFEWVNIAGILAGHYLAAPMPVEGRFPKAGAQILQIAIYCMFGSPIIFEEDLMILQTGDIVSPEMLRLRLDRLSFGPQRLNVEYLVDREPSPIVLLFVDNRVTALRHQERLVALLEAGVSEALCLISYGYTNEVLRFLPTIDSSFLAGERPPRIADFVNDQVTVRIPIHTPRTVLRFFHHAVEVGVTG